MQLTDIRRGASRYRSWYLYTVSSLQRIVPRRADPERVTAQPDLRRVKCAMIARVSDIVRMTILTQSISAAVKKASVAKRLIADYCAT